MGRKFVHVVLNDESVTMQGLKVYGIKLLVIIIV